MDHTIRLWDLDELRCVGSRLDHERSVLNIRVHAGRLYSSAGCIIKARTPLFTLQHKAFHRVMMQVLHVFEGDTTEPLYLVCVAGGGWAWGNLNRIKRGIREW